MNHNKSLILVGLLASILLSCNPAGEKASSTVESTAAVSAVPAQITESGDTHPETPPTPVVSPDPTPTSVPLIATVNGSGITLAEYQSELELYEDAVERDLTSDDEEIVLNDLIDRTLLAQAAVKQGIGVAQSSLDGRLEEITTNIGGSEALAEWMNSFGFDERSFHLALERSVNAALMRDEIITVVPSSAPQVHVRQILFLDENEAENALVGLNAGNSFENLAAEIDPVTKGDIGWFPRGVLIAAQIDEAAFDLDVNEISSVIETSAGYHIITVIEKDPQRPLTQEYLIKLQILELQEWIDNQRENSEIEVFSP